MASDTERLRREQVSTETPLLREDLERIVTEQVKRFIALGFHREVYPDLSKAEAKAKYQADFVLPKQAVQPPEYRGRFDEVLVVEPRISLTRKHKLAGRIKELDLVPVAKKWTTSQVADWINTETIQDLTPHPTDIQYLVFTHDGQRYCPLTVEQAIGQFASDEVGSPQLEMIGLFLQKPIFFDGRGIDAAGSRNKFGSVPYLDTFNGRPEVGAHSAGNQNQDWGALSRGKEIILLGS